jgi:hypothetical protein
MRGVMVKTFFGFYSLLVLGATLLNVACPPGSEECTNSIVALLVLSMPWSALLTFVAAVLLGLIGLPAVMFHVNYRINLLAAIPDLLSTLIVFGLLWGGVLANMVLLYRFAFAQVVLPPRPAEMPPEAHQSPAPPKASVAQRPPLNATLSSQCPDSPRLGKQ